MSQVCVLVEHRQGEIQEISYEMIGKGRQLAEALGTECYAIVLGADARGIIEKVASYVPGVYSIEDPQLAEYNAPAYQAAMSALIQEKRPQLVLIGHTASGMEFAPRLSAELRWPLASDCIDLAVNEGCVEATRKMYSDKVNARIDFKAAPHCLATIRAGSFSSELAPAHTAEVITVASPLTTEISARRFVRLLASEVGDVDITQADLLLSVGRGLGGPEYLPEVEALAKQLGAAVSCSRPVVDKNWLPKERQVGTSGKKVKPKVYIALGISGAFQHVAGMKNAGTIIAINKDPKAPIFGIADYGIVGDMFEIMPALSKILTSA